MGAYGSNCFNESGSITAEFCDPSSPHWISAHSETTRLTQSYVEELWERFKNIGGDSQNGLLEINAIPNPGEHEQLKTLLAEYPVDKDGNITFQTFCIALKWNENAKIEEKIKVCFKKINNDRPIDRDTLVELLKKMYTDDSEESIKRLASVFMSQMNGNTSEEITEKDFILWMKTMPFDTVRDVLHYFGQKEGENCCDGCHQLDKDIPSYEILEDIADKIHDQDWQPLAKRLGFVEEDIQGFQRMNPTIPRDQVQSMLNAWRNTNSSSATYDTLITAMKDCNMSDVASTVKLIIPIH